MKAIRMDSNYTFYLKVLFTIFLIASLAFLQSPYGGASVGNEVNPDRVKVRKEVDRESASSTVRIEKSVDKPLITMNPGESPEVTYTINVARVYTVTGTITVENKSSDEVVVTKVEDAVQYHEEGTGPWKKVEPTTTVFSGTDPIPPKPTGSGETDGKKVNERQYEYSITFTAPEGAKPNQWQNVAYVTVSNPDETFESPPKHFSLPKLEDDVDDEASISDFETVTPDSGVGFEVTSVTVNGTALSDKVGPWPVTLPSTIEIHKTVTASASAATGTSYTLHNTARIGEDGPFDSTDVTITIPSPTPTSNGGSQNQQTTGGGGGGGTEQGATVTSEAAPAPAPEQVAALPAVVSQPASAPEVVAQAKPAATPKKLPFTGLNFWYITLAVLLIMAGSLLQLFRSPQPGHSRKG